MNNKGFTLVELLAVIIILGLLLLITMISVNSILNSSKESLSETQKKRLEDAAEIYYLSEGMNRDSKCVSIEYLVLKGYLNSDEVLDPKTREPLEGSIAITYDSNRYSYEFQDDECLMPIFKPQYYWNGNIPSEHYNVGEEFTEEKSTVPQNPHEYYIGLDINSSDIVTSAYVCFIRNGEEYCLKGYDTSAYDRNVEILKEAFSDVVDNCSFGASSSECSWSSSMGLTVKTDSDGSVTAYGDGSECDINSDGEFYYGGA